MNLKFEKMPLPYVFKLAILCTQQSIPPIYDSVYTSVTKLLIITDIPFILKVYNYLHTFVSFVYVHAKYITYILSAKYFERNFICTVESKIPLINNYIYYTYK